MGVEYCHYLIPRPNSFRPNGAQLAKLVAALAKDNWIAVPGSDALRQMAIINNTPQDEAEDEWAYLQLPPRYDGRDESAPHSLTSDWFEEHLSADLKLIIPVEHADQIGLQYALTIDSELPDDPYYAIQIQACDDYIHHVSELIDAVEAICLCGESLEYHPSADPEEELFGDIFYASRIKSQCPHCRNFFDPSNLEVTVRDAWTGAESVIRGGAIYRFAVLIDCGKCIPQPKHSPIRANPSLLDLCQQVLGVGLCEVGDIY